MSVEIIREKTDYNELIVGDVVLIDGEPYMFSSMRHNEYTLVSLEDGNRFDDAPILADTLNYDDLFEYVNKNFDASEMCRIEIIKKDRYKLSLHIN